MTSIRKVLLINKLNIMTIIYVKMIPFHYKSDSIVCILIQNSPGGTFFGPVKTNWEK